MSTDSHRNTPYFTADPASVLPIALADHCDDPGSCYPTDDGELDVVKPRPNSVTGATADERPSRLFTPSLGEALVSAWNALSVSLRFSAALPAACHA